MWHKPDHVTLILTTNVGIIVPQISRDDEFVSLCSSRVNLKLPIHNLSINNL